MSCVVEAVDLGAENALIVVSDSATVADTESGKAGRADYVKALIVRIEESTISSHGFLSSNFTVSDGALASLVNCGLDLGVDELADARSIKRFREREGSQSPLKATWVSDNRVLAQRLRGSSSVGWKF